MTGKIVIALGFGKSKVRLFYIFGAASFSAALTLSGWAFCFNRAS